MQAAIIIKRSSFISATSIWLFYKMTRKNTTFLTFVLPHATFQLFWQPPVARYTVLPYVRVFCSFKGIIATVKWILNEKVNKMLVVFTRFVSFWMENPLSSMYSKNTSDQKSSESNKTVLNHRRHPRNEFTPNIPIVVIWYIIFDNTRFPEFPGSRAKDLEKISVALLT